MRMFAAPWILVLVLSLLSAGCQARPSPTRARPPAAADVEAELQANLAELAAEDRRLAEQQKYCPVMPEIRLGEMGTPHKVLVKGALVFVCCKACVRQAQEEPDKTIAQLKQLTDGALKSP